MKQEKKLLPEEINWAILETLRKILLQLEKGSISESLYYDSADVKRLLNISDRTLQRMRQNNEIPFLKLGKKIFYPKAFFNQEWKKK